MKRSLKKSKVSRRISVGAAGVALAALIGAGSAVGTVNVFAQEDTAVTTEQIEENVTVTDQAPEAEQTGDAATASPDTAKDGEENVTPEKTKAEDKTDAVNEYEKTEIISPAKTEERPETGGVGAVNTVEAVKNGWVKENGGYKYYKNGKAYTGWHKMGKAEGENTPHWSYFGKNGVVYTGWRKMGKAEGEKTTHWSFFGSNGWLRTGWVQLGKGTANPDGNSAKHWSFFGDNGWLRTGWVQLGKGTANPDGNTAKHWSYFGGNGWLRTGWVQFGKGTSEPDGNVAKHWSFFGDNGWLRTELQSMGKGTSNPDGNSAKHLSYFGSNGWLRVNQIVTVSGKKYKADGKGWLSAYNEENDVFMKYLKKIYNSADIYISGYPHKYDYEGGISYLKYAIADFDNDGKNELIIYSNGSGYPWNKGKLEVGYGYFKWYEADSSGNVKENSYTGCSHQGNKFNESTIDVYNNGVFVMKEKEESVVQYIPFNKSIRTSLKLNKKMYKDYSGYNYWYKYGSFYDYESSKTSYGYYCGAYGWQDSWYTYSMTKSEYDKEIKLLTSGKKINVTWKDFTAANIK